MICGQGTPRVVPSRNARRAKMYEGHTTMKRRYTIIEAAKALGVGTDAVRKRVARGTVEYEKVDNTVYVWLDNGHDGGTNGAELPEAYRGQLDAYKNQVDYLRSSLNEEREARRRADTIIAQLTQANDTLAGRVPELEALSESSESPETDSEEADKGAAAPPAKGERRSWWRRLFGP